MNERDPRAQTRLDPMSAVDRARLKLLGEAALDWSAEWFAGAHPISASTPAVTQWIGACSPEFVLALLDAVTGLEESARSLAEILERPQQHDVDDYEAAKHDLGAELERWR